MSNVSYLRRTNRPLLAYAILYLAFLYVPVMLLPLFSFNDGIYIAFPLKGFTTKWYEQMLAHSQMHAALLSSLKVGAVTAVIATALGVFGAKAVTRYRIRGAKPVIGVIMLPLVVPGIVLGVALLILLTRVGLQLSLVTVTIGHILICVPFSIATLMASFEGFDKSMEEAAADLGDNAWWGVLAGHLPHGLPGDSRQPPALFHDLLRRVHHGLLPGRHRANLADLHVQPAALPAEIARRPGSGGLYSGGLLRGRLLLAMVTAPRCRRLFNGRAISHDGR